MDLRNCKGKDFELQLLVRKRTHTCHAAAMAHSKQVFYEIRDGEGGEDENGSKRH